MITTNIEKFNRELLEWARRVPAEELTKLHRQMALLAMEKIDVRTPVKTGYTRFNNQLTVGDNPAYGVVHGYDPSGELALVRAHAALRGLPPFCLVTIHNSVPWIEKLEEGSSTQAPAGIYDITALELRAGFDSSIGAAAGTLT